MAWGGRWSGVSRPLSLGLAPLLVFLVDYHAKDQEFSFCLVKLITGHRCYGCGLLRGISAVLHGHPWLAYRLNPLNALTIPLLAWVYVNAWLKIRPLRQSHWRGTSTVLP